MRETEVMKREPPADSVGEPITERGVAEPTGPKTYRGYRIDYDPPPIPIRTCDWQFVHEDYDGPEDRRCGHAPSLEAAKAEIDMLEDDE